MPRGYRCIVIACLGFLILGNAEQHQRPNYRDQHKQAATKPTTTPKAPDIPLTKQAEQPCYPNSEVGVSCDGIAAKAAVDQARDADEGAALFRPQFAVGLATLVAAVFAAIFAWRAAVHTRRGADAAESQVRLSDDTSKRQLRAYVSAAHFRLKDFEAGKQLRATYELINSGSTPALAVNIWGEFFLSNVRRPDSIKIRGIRGFRSKYPGYINPGRTFIAAHLRFMPVSADLYTDFYNGDISIVFAGFITYRDAFGRRRFSLFKRYANLDSVHEDGSIHMLNCETGNTAN